MGRGCEVGVAPRCRMPEVRRGVSARTVVVTWTLVALIAPAACSSRPKRSAEAFCSTMRSEKKRILGQLDDADAQLDGGSGDPAESAVKLLMEIGQGIQAIGELRTYFHKLERVAPDEIRTEVGIVADAIDEQLDSAKDAVDNPLKALGGALVTGFMTSGQMQAVDTYAREHCGESI